MGVLGLNATLQVARQPPDPKRLDAFASFMRAYQDMVFSTAVRLVGDDRVHLENRAGRLMVWPTQELAGLLEVRGIGIVRVPFEATAVVGLVIELGQPGPRMPAAESRKASLEGVTLPRLAVSPETDPLPLAIEASLGRFGPI